MKGTVQLLILTLVVAACAGCSSLPFFKKPAVSVSQPDLPKAQPIVIQVPQPQAPVTDIAKLDSSKVTYRKEDITFLIKGDPQLNRYGNNSHALYLCIYQLKDPNAFNQLAEEKGGVGKLLECSRFDSSVANAKRLVVQPGQEIRETRDRAEGARFIGIAGGYYGTGGNEKMSHLAPLAVTNGDFSGNTVQVELGPYEIDNVTVK